MAMSAKVVTNSKPTSSWKRPVPVPMKRSREDDAYDRPSYRGYPRNRSRDGDNVDIVEHSRGDFFSS